MNFLKEFSETASLIRQKKNILLASHEHPDGDAIGSMLAMFSTLGELRDKNVVVFSQDPLPVYLKFLPNSEVIIHEVSQCFPDRSKADVFIGFDYGDFKRLGVNREYIEEAAIITFDHHPYFKQEGDILIIDDSASSTCEILYDFFVYGGFKISVGVATALLTGILTDSGGFAHINTSVRTLRAAGDLLRCGASLAKIHKHTFANKPLSCLKAWGYALSAAQHDSASEMNYIVISHAKFLELGGCLDDFEGVANTINLSPETKFSLVLIECEPNVIKASLRSESFKGVDVSSIARALGGGGHKYAAGFEITGKSLEDVVELVKNTAAELTATLAPWPSG